MGSNNIIENIAKKGGKMTAGFEMKVSLADFCFS